MATRTTAKSVSGRGAAGRIRVGIGGWTYLPWRETFYPAKLAQKRELEYASRQVTAIEVNGTFYRTQTPATFAKWREETPDDFVFSLKAPRYATNRRVLGEAGQSVAGFLASGVTELGEKLGPILWQLAPTKLFDADDIQAFLKLLPTKADGLRLHHALEVRHASFLDPAFIALTRRYKVATVFTDSPDYPSFADLSANFVYARLMRSTATIKTGYSTRDIGTWAQRAQTWAEGGQPADLDYVDKNAKDKTPRDVFVFMINGAKERAPAAACGLLEKLASG